MTFDDLITLSEWPRWLIALASAGAAFLVCLPVVLRFGRHRQILRRLDRVESAVQLMAGRLDELASGVASFRSAPRDAPETSDPVPAAPPPPPSRAARPSASATPVGRAAPPRPSPLSVGPEDRLAVDPAMDRRIRSLAAAGRSPIEIAREIGSEPGTVRLILSLQGPAALETGGGVPDQA